MKVGRGGHFWLGLGVEIIMFYVLGDEILAWDKNEDIPCLGTSCNVRSILS